MKNLIIGSDGFVGTELCNYLRNCGENVISIDLKRGNEFDCRYMTLPLEEIDRVYFLAWDVGGSKYLYNDETQIAQMNWNIELMKNVFNQLESAKLPFLFVSTQLATETDTVYGVCKRLGEVWTKQLGGVAVRLWNVYGPQEDSNIKSHVIADFINQATSNKEIKMLSTGEEYRQFIHIDDVVRGFKHALDINATRVCDVTSFEWVQVKNVANIIASYSNSDIVYGDLKSSSVITPLREKLEGWTPKVMLKEGLEGMVDEVIMNNSLTVLNR